MTQHTEDSFYKELPLLSNSFCADLSNIAQIYDCAISRALVAAHEGKVKVTDFCRMVTARNVVDETQEVQTENINLSFLPKDKEPEYSESGNWARKNRQTGRPSKIAQSLLEFEVSQVVVKQVKHYRTWYDYYEELGLITIQGNIKSTIFLANIKDYETREIKRINTTYTAKMYEDFANNIKSFYECKFEFKILEGNDLNDHYNYETYYDVEGEKGTLWGSCMRDVSNDYFDFYSKNGVKLLVAFYCDKVVGRALLWETNQGVFMDRVYFYYQYLETLFCAYAAERKWMYKTDQGSGNPRGVMKWSEEEQKYTGDSLPLSAVITVVPERYPYCDTFKYFDGHSKVTNDDENPLRFLLESTEGERILEQGMECADCHDEFEEDELFYISSQEIHVCEDCSVVDYHGDRQVRNNCRQLFDGRWALWREVTAMSDGEWALRDEVVITYNNRFIHESDVTRLFDGKIAYADYDDIVIIGGGDYIGEYALREQTKIENDIIVLA